MSPMEGLHYFKSWLQKFIKFKGNRHFSLKMDDAEVVTFCINRLTVRASYFTLSHRTRKISCDSLFLFYADRRCQ